MRRRLAFLSVALLCGGGTLRAQQPAYKNPALPTAARVRDLLGRMTTEEKFWQLWMVPGDLDSGTAVYKHGVFGLQVREQGDGTPERDPGAAARRMALKLNAMQRFFIDSTRLGIPIIPFEEAVHGLYGRGATVFPAAIALAATWDTALMARVATAIATESRTRGVRQVLSPVINIANDVRWGRVEETYGEDPWLSSEMALAFVRPFEKMGVVTTPKHFIANVGEGGRDSYPIDYDERLLDEEFFPPFKAAIQQGGARSVMASYNSVNGLPATANEWLLTKVLRDDWHFGGIVIGDQAATGGAQVLHFTSPNNLVSTRQAIEAGLDVIFQSNVRQYTQFWPAFEHGMIDPRAIDRAVARVLTLKFELGLFEHPYVDPDEAARRGGSTEHRALALEAARASITLLKNDSATLPLRKTIRSIAVIGTDADDARLGGYSSEGNDKVSILRGIREKLGAGVAVHYAPGPGRFAVQYVPVPAENLVTIAGGTRTPGLAAEYFDNNRLEGEPRVKRQDAHVDFGWTLNSPARGIPFDWYSVRWTGRLVAPATETVRLGVEGNDGYRLYFNGVLLIDDWQKKSYGSHLKEVQLEGGREYDLRLEYFESTGNARVKLVWSHGVPDDWRAKIDSAVQVARASDVAVVVGGIEEGEFRDRSSLKLPGHQEELIDAVAATEKPVVVAVVGGSAVTMRDWVDRVGAVLDVWYPGEVGGTAVADVLFGDHDPSGRLPVTFPMTEGQLPLTYNHKPTGRGDDYLDGTGQPEFPFGFGLSYTTFDYTGLSIEPAAVPPDGTATVRCTVRNTGTVAGDEVVELYLHREVSSVAQPLIALKGFQRIHLGPGESKELSFTLSRDQLSLFDAKLRSVVEPGTFRVLIGRSSKDIRLRGSLQVK
ncbi:MAG: glycoside hydrolase family 3 C-terminal domain-containing protein [Gemmatimonadales bacterium]